jgi:hypothetical protein
LHHRGNAKRELRPTTSATATRAAMITEAEHETGLELNIFLPASQKHGSIYEQEYGFQTAGSPLDIAYYFNIPLPVKCITFAHIGQVSN